MGGEIFEDGVVVLSCGVTGWRGEGGGLSAAGKLYLLPTWSLSCLSS